MEPNKIIEIYSEKHKTNGRIEHYSMVTKLIFTYEGRDHTIGIRQSLNADLAQTGLQMMETAIERLVTRLDRVYLHYWYIEQRPNGMLAHGIVNGHPKLADSIRIHTSKIKGIEIDEENGEAVISTENTDYHCPLNYWRFRKQDKYPDAIEEYEELKAKYRGKIDLPEIEQGKVLLVLSDFDEFYFHSLCVRNDDGSIADFSGYPHIGMFQDSYLISAEGHSIDIRYFPHFKGIEFYSLDTEGMPLYIENIGYGDLYITDKNKRYCLKAGERQAYSELTADEEIREMPDGDLYPAGT